MENVPWLDPVSARVFATTRWTMIDACRQTDKAQARRALEELCQTYWQPVYVCVRGHGYCAHDAQDLTQDFFLRLLKGSWLDRLDEAKGRFRAYLSVTLSNFLRDRWRRRWTLRRKHGLAMVSFDAAEAEAAFSQAPANWTTPESLYELQWARSLVDHALEQLRIELRGSGREAVFNHFNALMTADARDYFAETAQQLGLDAGATRALLYRWRRRFHALLREEVARTVVAKSDVEAELRYLHRVFAQAR